MLKSFGINRYVEIIPNAMTVGALCFGLSSVRFAMAGDFPTSIQCLACSAILDGLDGHAARALKASTSLGAELDSLCDLADFGVAPCFILFLWAMQLSNDGGAISDNHLWASCVFYCACCSLRLGRFNTKSKAVVEKAMTPQSSKGNKKEPYRLPLLRNIDKKKLYFAGIPAPMGAAVALTPVAWDVGEFSGLSVSFQRWHAVVVMVGTGIMMISTIPTFSSKMLMRSKKSTHLRSLNYFRVVIKIVGSVIGLWCLVNAPMTVFCAINIGYVASIPLSVVAYVTIAK